MIRLINIVEFLKKIKKKESKKMKKNNKNYDTGFEGLPNMSDLFDALFLVNRCEDIKKVNLSHDLLGFLICPCHLNSYIMLKIEKPDLAILYLEDLLIYGMTGCHITNNFYVRALIENSEPILRNQQALFRQYYEARCKRDSDNGTEDKKNPYFGSFDDMEWV